MSKIYNHVLVASDLVSDTGILLDRIGKLVDLTANDFSIVHVCEPLPNAGYTMVGGTQLEEEIYNDAKNKMAEFSSQMKQHCQVTHEFIEIGIPKAVIMEKAKEIDADLIIVGSHGKHGIQLLLGSTATSVLHHADCDVMVVRIKD